MFKFRFLFAFFALLLPSLSFASPNSYVTPYQLCEGSVLSLPAPITENSVLLYTFRVQTFTASSSPSGTFTANSWEDLNQLAKFGTSMTGITYSRVSGNWSVSYFISAFSDSDIAGITSFPVTINVYTLTLNGILSNLVPTPVVPIQFQPVATESTASGVSSLVIGGLTSTAFVAAACFRMV